MIEHAAQQLSEDDRFGQAKRALADVLERMGLDVEIEGEEQDEQIDLRVHGEDAASLVGKKGRTLDALQFLINKIVSRRVAEHKLVVLDADSYRKRREASLLQLAERLGDKAVEEGKIIRLNPMSPRDRRVIHMALRDVSGLSTRSEGDGEERRLLIVPER
ncbi:MAG: RNA-binding protein [Proteobacteria bacterium]|nr:MAG: RNA-binding protein [Pseudomonadota bacterium]